jgi:5'(3')-deoxyribonucleotidase
MTELNKLLTEDMQDSYTIYVDLDGTLSDFEERFSHYTGLSPEEYKQRAERQFGPKIGVQKFWDVINTVGMRFFRGMKWMPEGRQLWDYVKQYNPIILTAPSRDPSSIEGKKHWVKDNLGDYDIEFRQADKKADFAGPNQILIDDRPENIMDWKARNGIGILYTGDTQSTINELQQLGL